MPNDILVFAGSGVSPMFANITSVEVYDIIGTTRSYATTLTTVGVVGQLLIGRTANPTGVPLDVIVLALEDTSNIDGPVIRTDVPGAYLSTTLAGMNLLLYNAFATDFNE